MKAGGLNRWGFVSIGLLPLRDPATNGAAPASPLWSDRRPLAPQSPAVRGDFARTDWQLTDAPGASQAGGNVAAQRIKGAIIRPDTPTPARRRMMPGQACPPILYS